MKYMKIFILSLLLILLSACGVDPVTPDELYIHTELKFYSIEKNEGESIYYFVDSEDNVYSFKTFKQVNRDFLYMLSSRKDRVGDVPNVDIVSSYYGTIEAIVYSENRN